MEDNIKLKMTLPDIPNIELVAVEGLDKMARHIGISDEKIGEARILVTEAIINAIEHSGKKNSEVDVEFTMTKKNLVIFVRDYGKGFKPELIEDPDIRKKLGAESKRGWGLKLMKSMSDDFLIESNDTGTKITLIKNLS
jgi:anti-sigma regulatory factor (Ser/Thr protein kinase)